MADTTSSEAPFPIAEINHWSIDVCAGFLASREEIERFHLSPGGRADYYPLYVELREFGGHRFGIVGEPVNIEDFREACRFVHRTLWPKPAPKPIDDMAQGECFLAAEKLGARIGTTLITGNHIGVYKRYGFTAQCCPDEFGSREAALRNAVYHLAMRVGRYNPTTGTITEATDD